MCKNVHAHLSKHSTSDNYVYGMEPLLTVEQGAS